MKTLRSLAAQQAKKTHCKSITRCCNVTGVAAVARKPAIFKQPKTTNKTTLDNDVAVGWVRWWCNLTCPLTTLCLPLVVPLDRGLR